MKKVIITVITIIVVITIIITAGLIYYYTNNPKDRLQKIYEKMISEKVYVFTISNQNEENKIVTSRKGDNTLIDTYNLGEHTSTLVIEGNTYLILHDNQEYYTYANNKKDEEILTDELKRITEKSHVDGKEEVNGTMYYYEEYDGITDFLINTYKDMDLNTAKTKFYFKGRNLKYIKTEYKIVDSETGKSKDIEELLKVNMEYKVKDDIFKIPAEYAEI